MRGAGPTLSHPRAARPRLAWMGPRCERVLGCAGTRDGHAEAGLAVRTPRGHPLPGPGLPHIREGHLANPHGWSGAGSWTCGPWGQHTCFQPTQNLWAMHPDLGPAGSAQRPGSRACTHRLQLGPPAAGFPCRDFPGEAQSQGSLEAARPTLLWPQPSPAQPCRCAPTPRLGPPGHGFDGKLPGGLCLPWLPGCGTLGLRAEPPLPPSPLKPGSGLCAS